MTCKKRKLTGHIFPWRPGAAALSVLFLFLFLTTPVVGQQSDPAHQQFLFAYKLLQRGDDAFAAEAFDEFLGKFPQAPKRGDAMYYLALLHHREGEKEKAAELLRQAPSPVVVPQYAADLLQGQVLSDLGRYDQALEALERIEPEALETSVTVAVLYLRGLAYRGAGRLTAAADELTAAAAVDSPMKARALLDLARVQVLSGQSAEAIETLRWCLDLRKPAEHAAAAEAARMAGDLSYKGGAYDDAVAFYGRVLDRHQNSRHFGAAVVGTLWTHFAAGRHSAVLENFDRHRTALRVQDRIPAWYLAASAHQELGQHEAAVALLEQISHRGGKYPLAEKVLYKLAASRFELGQDEQMTQAINRLREQYPGSEVLIDSEYLLAAAEARGTDVSRGAARLTKLIDQGETNPYFRQALLLRARLFERHGRADAAAADLRRYLDAADTHDPKVAQIALHLIDLAMGLGRFEQTEAVAAGLLQQPDLDPVARQRALFGLAVAQEKLNKYEQAQATLACLQRDLPLNPYGTQITYRRALLMMSLERPGEAVDLLKQAASDTELSNPQRVNMLRLLAMVQRDGDQPEAAAQTLIRIEQLASVHGLTDAELLWLGRYFQRREEDLASLRYLEPLVEARPGAAPTVRAEAQFVAGRAQRRLGRFVEATTSFGQVIGMGQGREQQAQLELAGTLADRGRRDEALMELAGLVSSGSTPIEAEAIFASALIHRQVAQERSRRDDKAAANEANTAARRLLKRLVLLYPFEELTPLPQLAYLELAEIAAELGEIEAAQSELGQLIDKYPADLCAEYARAVLEADRRRLGDALARVRRLADQPLDDRLASRVEALVRYLESKQ